MSVSAAQQRDQSHICVHSFSYTIFHRVLAQETEHCSLCDTAGPHRRNRNRLTGNEKRLVVAKGEGEREGWMGLGGWQMPTLAFRTGSFSCSVFEDNGWAPERYAFTPGVAASCPHDVGVPRSPTPPLESAADRELLWTYLLPGSPRPVCAAPAPTSVHTGPSQAAAWVRRSCEALEDQNTLDSTDPPLPEMPREDALLGSFSAQQPHQPQTPQRPLWLVARPGSDDSRLLVTAPPAAGQPGFLRRPRLSGRRGQAFWSGAKLGLLAPLRSKPARTPRKPLLCPAVFIF